MDRGRKILPNVLIYKMVSLSTNGRIDISGSSGKYNPYLIGMKWSLLWKSSTLRVKVEVQLSLSDYARNLQEIIKAIYIKIK